MASSLFAWSISADRPFPFNSGFTYYVLGILMLITSLFVYTLPKNINNALGRISDVFHSNDVEMKEVKEEITVAEVKQETEIVSTTASDPVKAQTNGIIEFFVMSKDTSSIFAPIGVRDNIAI